MTNQYIEKKVPLIDLTLPYLYACPKIVPGFPTKCGVVGGRVAIFSVLYILWAQSYNNNTLLLAAIKYKKTRNKVI
jgi:hypothetical protein